MMISDTTWLIDQAYQGANADDALVFCTGARYPYFGENDNDSLRRSFWWMSALTNVPLCSLRR